MSDIATLLAQKHAERQQLQRMQAELQQNLQRVQVAILRAEGAIAALQEIATTEDAVPSCEEGVHANGVAA